MHAFIKFATYCAVHALKNDSDIVFATSTPLTVAIPAIIASRWHKAPLVFEVRDLWPEIPIAINAIGNPMLKFLAKQLEKLAYFSSEAVIALSPGMKEGIAKTGYSPKRIAVIPNFSNIEAFQLQSDSPSTFRQKRPWLQTKEIMMYAGSIGYMNGIMYAIEIAKKLMEINSNTCIVIIGDGAEKAKITKAAQRCGILNKTLFIESWIPKKEIPNAFNSAEIIATFFIDLPEMQINSSNKFFDGLASGKPIFINYGGWHSDLIETYKCGIVSWNKPTLQTAIEIDTAMKDKAWLKQSGQASLELAKTRFSLESQTEKFVKILSSARVGKGYLSQDIAQ